MEDRLLVRTQVNEIEDYLQAAELTLYTSESESFCLGILEAMFFGCPGVSFGVGGIPEVVGNGETGVLVPFGDAGALARENRDPPAGSPPAARRWARPLPATPRARFSADCIVPLYEALYRRVVAERRDDFQGGHMRASPSMKRVFVVATGWLLLSFAAVEAQAPPDKVETIIVIRHGEKPGSKPHDDKGQLSPAGLRRALLLPDVLLGNSAARISSSRRCRRRTSPSSSTRTFTCGPLMTIEPTAVQLGMPVDTKYAYSEVDKLVAELTSDPYQGATVFVAWEHVMMVKFVRLMLTSFGGSAPELVDWPGNDYDSIFILRINTDAQGKRRITLSKDREGLNAVVNPPPT